MSSWDDLFVSESERRYFGLDYGTSRSLFAFKMENQKPEVLIPENQICRSGIPSLFWYRKEKGTTPGIQEELVCDEVITYNGQVEDPEGVVLSVKMHLTEDYLRIHGKKFATQDIMYKQMRRIHALSTEELNVRGLDSTISTLVVGTPVRAGAYEKEKTLRAAQQLLPEATIKLLPEPYAAALYANSLAKAPLSDMLVFDFGAGTFDTCVLVPNDRITPNDPYPYKVLASNGLAKAGDLLDELMEELILEKLSDASRGVRLNVLRNKTHHDRRALRATARNAKENLSNALATTVMVTGAECGSAVVTLERKEYETLIRPALAEVVNLAADTLRKAGKWNDPKLTILMVGGSSYIPLVRSMLLEKFSWLSDNQVIRRFPEQAIALGCALFAENPLVERKVAYGYAIDTYLYGTDQQVLHVRIPADCSLPFSATASYLTRFDRQTGIRFNLYEVPDARMDDNLPMDSGTMKQFWMEHQFGKPVPKGTRVYLTATLDQNGILTLEVDDDGISNKRKTKRSINFSTQSY